MTDQGYVVNFSVETEDDVTGKAITRNMLVKFKSAQDFEKMEVSDFTYDQLIEPFNHILAQKGFDNEHVEVIEIEQIDLSVSDDKINLDLSST